METTVDKGKGRVEVCFSPQLFETYFTNEDCIVVVIDVFRASSAICTAFHEGISRIYPVPTVEEALAYKNQGMLAAAERHGEVVEGFDFGNSPFSYMNPNLKGKELALTTTNGTKALAVAKNASEIIVGSFLNLNAISQYLSQREKDVILLCAGWKNRFNLEDSLFAGAVVSKLKDSSFFQGFSDSSIAAAHLYDMAKSDLNQFLINSSHRTRLARLNLEKDIRYCLQESIFEEVPVYRKNYLCLEEES